MTNFTTFGKVSGGSEGTAPAIFNASTPDSLGTITTAGYLNAISAQIKANDIFEINYSDTSTFPLNTGESATYGRFQVTYDSGGGNWTLVEATLSSSLLHARVAMTAAQWDGMYAAPYLLVAAPGANKILIVDQIDIGLTYGSVVLAAGGVVGAQYDSTVHGAGVAASTTLAAADFFVTASNMFQLQDSLSTGAPFTTSVNKGLYLSNLTGAFTGGTGTTFIIDTYYRSVSTV